MSSLIDKLESDSLDAICEVIGAPREYNSGKSAMRSWFIERLKRDLGQPESQIDFSTFNRLRCESADGFNHPLSSWTLSDWMTATLGELGEAANVIKKLNRHRDGIAETQPAELLLRQLADELSDAFIYLDLLFQAAGIDKIEAVKAKFNDTSLKRGAPYLIGNIGIGSTVQTAQPAGSQAFSDVLAERRRQIEAEGWSPEHDDTHEVGELARAGACYALATAGFSPHGAMGQMWPKTWDIGWLKFGAPRRMLVKAAALLIAEIERLDRRAERDRRAA